MLRLLLLGERLALELPLNALLQLEMCGLMRREELVRGCEELKLCGLMRREELDRGCEELRLHGELW